jgi:hypothetical protein
MTGRRSSLVYGTAIAICVSILLGSLAMTAQAGYKSDAYICLYIIFE